MYLLGILNSRLSHFYLSEVCAGLEGTDSVYLRFFGQYLSNFPVGIIDFSISSDTEHYNKMVVLVKGMLGLHKSFTNALTSTEKEIIQRQIENTDKQIDALVYELYRLTDEEIKIVEESRVS